TAKIRRTQVDNVEDICQKYAGNDDGDEPVENGSGPDSEGLEIEPLKSLLSQEVMSNSHTYELDGQMVVKCQ
ncbi:hypothetical protein C0992_007160, partial [Termitomyces sp. T32_za158]